MQNFMMLPIRHKIPQQKKNTKGRFWRERKVEVTSYAALISLNFSSAPGPLFISG